MENDAAILALISDLYKGVGSAQQTIQMLQEQNQLQAERIAELEAQLEPEPVKEPSVKSKQR